MSTLASASDPSIRRPDRLTFLAIREDAREHERAAQRAVARRLAAVLGCDFVECGRGDWPARGSLGYVVPDRTLVSLEEARALGIEREDDIFGGLVPSPVVATKTITHPLVASDAASPPGWEPAFAERVKGHVLPGFSAFSKNDARRAALQMLGEGPVRLKAGEGIGGSGQSVAHDAAELDAALSAMAPEDFGRGLVIERQLDEIRTFSVGSVRVPGLRISYVGTQCATLNRHGVEVYGGSSLHVVQGGFEALAALQPEPPMRLAIEQARTYHEAALACFRGMIASRCNYDVAAGRDQAGRPHAGVLEQSWRIGGASGAEIAALEVFAREPWRRSVRASTVEVHGDAARVPEGATLSFRGVDELLGPITKYTKVDDE